MQYGFASAGMTKGEKRTLGIGYLGELVSLLSVGWERVRSCDDVGGVGAVSRVFVDELVSSDGRGRCELALSAGRSSTVLSVLLASELGVGLLRCSRARSLTRIRSSRVRASVLASDDRSAVDVED